MAAVRFRDLVEDLALGAVSGYVATRVMDPVSTRLYQWEPGDVRRREDAVRPGSPSEIAADKAAQLAGVQLTERQRERAGMVVHYGLAAGWAPLYALVRRRWRTRVLPTAFGVGAAISAIVDETVTPLLGFSAPNRAYPVPTHVRGVLAHLAFGAAVAAVTEAGWALRRRRP